MAADRWAQALRHQLGLGRLLPLGDAADAAWLMESAAVTKLREAASREVPQVRLGRMRISPSPAEGAASSVVPLPPSGLPPGPLDVEADFAATADAPLASVGEQLRTALLTAAEQELGLRMAAVDLHVTDLLDRPADDAGGADPAAAGDGRPEEAAHATGHEEARQAQEEHPPAPADRPQATATAEAVIAVPGVTRLAPVLGSTPSGLPGEAVTVTDQPGGGRHLQIQLAVADGTRALDVARAVRRAAVKAAAWDAPEPTVPATVAVLISAIDPDIGSGGERTGQESVRAG